MSDLTQALLSEEILTLNRDGASGVLAAALSEGTQKSLFFRSGRIVFACSSLEKDKLGEHLIKLGRISRADFANAYKESLSRKQRLGQTLVNAGLVGADDLGRLVALQVQKIVLSMFTWTMGETRFSAMVDPIHDDLCVDLSTRRLLFEGSRVFPDVVRLEAALGNPERRVRVAARPPFDVGRIALSPAEKSVIRDATNEPRISDVLAGSFPRPLLVRGIYSLFVGGIIEPIESQEIIVSSIEEDTVGFRLALTPVPVAAAATPVDTSQADLKQRVLQMYEALPRATHYEVLGVSYQSSLDDIEAAHERQENEQNNDWAALSQDLRLSSILTTLRFRRREAYLVLSTPIRRADYDRFLAQTQIMGPVKGKDDEAKNREQAQQLFHEAKHLLERGDRDPAIALLLQAVELDGKANNSRRLLALTLSQHPTMSRNAERHFLTAIEYEPNDVDLRFRLALYYKRLGLTARAIVQLKTIIGLRPDHDAARRELNAIDLTSKKRK